MEPSLALHAWEPRSRANGPGARFVLWFQGCSLGCPGCFNPATHAAGGARRPIEHVVADILAQDQAIEGVTLSGGEPLEQPEAALALIQAIRARSELSILVFSGHTIDEIQAQPLGPDILARIDVLVDGRYDAGQRLGHKLRGSKNQRIHLLTERYGLAQVEATPEAEIRIDARGRLTFTGVSPLRLKR
jgi:anaerobic ribonucleoside-triphosphate reductase activating protein